MIDKNFIEKILANPDKIERGYKSRLIAQGALDDKHILRIVYEENEKGIKVITMYPGRRTRYEKD